MQIEMLRWPLTADWLRCKQLAAQTMGLTVKMLPDGEWIEMMLHTEHSPLRTIMFTIRLVDIPYCNVMHLVRHKHGIEHYVSSQRNDRQKKYDRDKAPQDAPVTYIMDVNAQELIEMSRARLCSKASARTREIMAAIREEVEKVSPEVARWMHPRCYFGWCREKGGPCAICETYQNPYRYTEDQLPKQSGK